MRAVALHEHLGRRVRLIPHGSEQHMGICELITEDGYLHVRIVGEGK